jgi:8-amino-7-oxononanoate synthase
VSVSSLDSELRAELDQLRAAGLYRELRHVEGPQGPRVRVDGRELLNFSSNDYLGLAGHAGVKEAAARAVRDFGSGSGASRLICGSLAPHDELDEAIAQFKGTEAALGFSTGYATAVGLLSALLGKEDVVIVDKLVHACVVDGARLSGARLRVYRHNDPADLEAKLKWAASRARAQAAGRGARGARGASPRVLVVTESVFSMDGDLAPLREIVELKERYGAWLMVDEAHATGLFGERRRGLVEAHELTGRVEIQMGTLGKALGAAGGYIAGSRPLVDLLINRARSFIFSTAPVPAAAAAATAAVKLVESAEGERLRQQLWQRVDAAKNAVIQAGFALPPVQSAILPLVIGEEKAAVQAASRLREEGVFIPPIRYPTVARGQARLRLTISAAHALDDVAALGAALRRWRVPA